MRRKGGGQRQREQKQQRNDNENDYMIINTAIRLILNHH